jgi:hypothetical protein
MIIAFGEGKGQTNIPVEGEFVPRTHCAVTSMQQASNSANLVRYERRLGDLSCLGPHGYQESCKNFVRKIGEIQV